MAVTNGWGKGVDNNTINWGRGKDNATNNWGKIYETSASGDTALAVSTPSFANTKSLDFDAVDDYATTDATYSVLNGLDKMSISLWIKPDSLAYEMLLSVVRNATAAHFQFSVTLSTTGQIRFFTETSSRYTYTNASVISTGAWHHVLIALDKTQAVNANRCRIYINGADETGGFNNQGTASLYTSTSNLSFGKSQNNYFPILGGKMDEVAIWANLQLSSGDATTLYNSGTPNDLNNNGLTAPTNWWRFEEGSGTTISDSSGSADGTLINGTAFSSDVPT